MSNFQNILLTCYTIQTVIGLFILLALVGLVLAIGSLNEKYDITYAWFRDFSISLDNIKLELKATRITNEKNINDERFDPWNLISDLRLHFTQKNDAEGTMLIDSLEKRFVKKGKRNGNKVVSNSPGV